MDTNGHGFAAYCRTDPLTREVSFSDGVCISVYLCISVVSLFQLPEGSGPQSRLGTARVFVELGNRREARVALGQAGRIIRDSLLKHEFDLVGRCLVKLAAQIMQGVANLRQAHRLGDKAANLGDRKSVGKG